ncbi:hypothetical protein [Streptomyces sp. NPDC004728]|uniref:hypothetical protein n=1 Tax=Streptomyces sp. NPDC004728 TaxID=3154289 RepID=UPI0033A02B56
MHDPRPEQRDAVRQTVARSTANGEVSQCSLVRKRADPPNTVKTSTPQTSPGQRDQKNRTPHLTHQRPRITPRGPGDARWSDKAVRQEGRAEWADGPDWSANVVPEELAADKNLATDRVFDPRRSTRTAARDTAESMQAIWADRTGALLSAGGCGRWRGGN